MSDRNAAVIEIVEQVSGKIGDGRGVIIPRLVRVNGTDIGLLKTTPIVSMEDDENPDRPGPVTVTLVLYASSVTIKAEAEGDDSGGVVPPPFEIWPTPKPEANPDLSSTLAEISGLLRTLVTTTVVAHGGMPGMSLTPSDVMRARRGSVGA